MPDGFDSGGGGFDFGGIFDPIIGVLVAVINAIITFLNALVSALVQVLNFLYAGELGIFGFSDTGLKHVWTGLKNIMDQVFKVFVLGALKHLKDLYAKLQAFLKKLKPWLDKLRKLQAAHAAALRRFINMIQRMRKVLVIFRILHLKFATKLDDWLAGIEGRLITREADILRKTNEIVAWINIVADPTSLFRQVPLLRSVGRGIRDMVSAVDAAGVKNLFPGLVQTTGPGVPQRPWSDVIHQLHSEVKDNSGDYGGFVRQRQMYREMFNQGFSTTDGSR